MPTSDRSERPWLVHPVVIVQVESPALLEAEGRCNVRVSTLQALLNGLFLEKSSATNLSS